MKLIALPSEKVEASDTSSMPHLTGYVLDTTAASAIDGDKIGTANAAAAANTPRGAAAVPFVNTTRRAAQVAAAAGSGGRAGTYAEDTGAGGIAVSPCGTKVVAESTQVVGRVGANAVVGGSVLQYDVVDVRGPEGDWLALFDASDNTIYFNRWRWAKDISEQNPLNCEGAICTSRLQLLLHTLAHELVHAMVFNVFPEMDKGSPAYLADDRHGPIFHFLNRQLFGHTDSGALAHVQRSGRRSTGMKLLR
jgi:hypothetical protein